MRFPKILSSSPTTALTQTEDEATEIDGNYINSGKGTSAFLIEDSDS